MVGHSGQTVTLLQAHGQLKAAPKEDRLVMAFLPNIDYSHTNGRRINTLGGSGPVESLLKATVPAGYAIAKAPN